MDAIRLTHFFTHFRKLGGVESVLKGHLVRDAGCGIRSNILAFFEPKGKIQDRVSGLGLTWRDCVTSARRKFRARPADFNSDIALYHNFWGIPFLADLDAACRRVALLHSDWPNLERGLYAQRGLVDGVICVNDVLQSQVQRAIPSLPAERIFVAPLPIDSPGQEALHAPLQNRPIVLGFCGRVIREQKRVDRFVELCRTLDFHRIDYRFEILGDGPARSWLESQFRSHARVHFHGRRSGAEYWQIVSQWDAILFVSDYEGLPISLLESFACGVLPIYPRIQSGGDSYVDRVSPDFLYESGDLESMVRVVKDITQAPEEEIAALRRACRRLAAPHEGNAYYAAVADFIRRIRDWPPIAPQSLPTRRAFPSDLCPFGLMRRVYYKGFYRRNDGW